MKDPHFDISFILQIQNEEQITGMLSNMIGSGILLKSN